MCKSLAERQNRAKLTKEPLLNVYVLVVVPGTNSAFFGAVAASPKNIASYAKASYRLSTLRRPATCRPISSCKDEESPEISHTRYCECYCQRVRGTMDACTITNGQNPHGDCPCRGVGTRMLNPLLIAVPCRFIGDPGLLKR